LGLVYEKQQNYNLALKAFQVAYDNFDRLGIQSGKVVSLNNIGHLYTDTRRYEEAYNVYLDALKINESLGGKRSSIVSTLTGLAATSFYLDEYKEAISHYQKALDLARNTDRYKTLQTYKGLENSYAALNDFKQAYAWGKRHRALSNSLFNTDNKQQLEDLRQQFELEKAEKEAEVIAAKYSRLDIP